MSWRSSQLEDISRIVLPEDLSFDIHANFPDTDSSREMLHENARTWVEDEEILAVVGVAPIWKGVGVVWTMLTDRSRERGVRLSIGIVRLLKMLHEERGYWRIQATTERGDESARLWIIQLGFRYEGTMIGYGPDMKTHDMYARVRF